jgi:SAM-dependent methyltransferase
MANGYDLPFADKVFDCVICSEVIEHVQRPERLLAEMQRVLTPTGRFVLTTPCRLHEHPERFHAHEFFPDELKALLLKAGFGDVAVQLSHPVAMSDLYALRWPMLLRRPFHHLFNLASVLGVNPFHLTGFRTYELMIANGRNRATHG